MSLAQEAEVSLSIWSIFSAGSYITDRCVVTVLRAENYGDESSIS